MKKIHKFILLPLLSFAIFFTSSANAMVQTGEQSGINYKLEYPIVYTANEAAQNLINSDIAKYIDSFKGTFDKGGMLNGNISYIVKYEDDSVISLLLSDYRYSGGVHGHYHTYGLVYSKNTGQEVPLSSYLNISIDQLHRDLLDNWAHITNENGTYVKYDYKIKRVKRIPDDYYLSGDGSVSLIFSPYELASFADGAVHISISRNLIDYHRRLNNGNE